MKRKVDLQNVNMKKLFRRNQIIVTTLAVMIAVAGYLNYMGSQSDGDQGAYTAGNTSYEAGALEISDEDILKENQTVLNGAEDYQEIASLDGDQGDGLTESVSAAELTAVTDSAGQDGNQNRGQNTGQNDQTEQTGLENPGEAILTSGMSVSDYIASVQLSREQIRAKNKETLLNIINNQNIEETAKQQAIQDMIALTEVAEKENAAETLLMAKGFADPVVSISSGKVDVVVNAPSITDAQRAQIEDIVKRKAEVGAVSIIITLLNLSD